MFHRRNKINQVWNDIMVITLWMQFFGGVSFYVYQKNDLFIFILEVLKQLSIALKLSTISLFQTCSTFSLVECKRTTFEKCCVFSSSIHWNIWKHIAFTWRKKNLLCFFWINKLIISELWEFFMVFQVFALFFWFNELIFHEKKICPVFLN